MRHTFCVQRPHRGLVVLQWCIVCGHITHIHVNACVLLKPKMNLKVTCCSCLLSIIWVYMDGLVLFCIEMGPAGRGLHPFTYPTGLPR